MQELRTSHELGKSYSYPVSRTVVELDPHVIAILTSRLMLEPGIIPTQDQLEHARQQHIHDLLTTETEPGNVQRVVDALNDLGYDPNNGN